MKKIFLLFNLLFLSVSVFAQQSSFTEKTGSAKASIESLEEHIPVLMKKADVPGMSVALIQEGKLVWAKSFGVKNSETNELVTNKSIFEAASLSKPVAAYAVLKLVDQGKIDLDTPLNKYLGNNYDAGDDKRIDLITARRVLSHTSGFPNWRRPRDSETLPINFTPGEKFSYSGEGFVYLSKVVEKITGMEFEDFIRKMVFTPLKMNNSSFVWQDSYQQTKVFNHDALGVVGNRREDKKHNAAASLQTTAEEYAKFVIALLNGNGLKKRTHQQMLTSQIKINEEKFPNLSWGLGVGLEEDGKGNSFWHWGDNGNNKAFVIANSKTKNGILFFSNGRNGLSFVKEVLADGLGIVENASVKWLDYERFDSPARILFKEIVDKNVETALKTYRQKRKENNQIALSESAMNGLGYQLLFMKKHVEAIGVFEQNAADFPASANAWDSLAEGYMVKGDKELAIKYYQKSLQLNPENKNAEDKLKELGSTKN